jgi:hypothetical protein
MSLNRIVSHLLHGRASPSEINTIIDVVISHARTYLRWLIWNRNYTITPTGIALDDLALDLVAELVSEIDGENLQRLRNALIETLSKDSDVEEEDALKAIVYRTVQVNLVRLFIEMHPVRSRLLRSLRRYEQENAHIQRHESVSGYWYSYTAHDARLELEAAPAELLLSFPLSIGRDRFPARIVLRQLLDELMNYPEWRQAVAEDDVLDLALHLIQTDQRAAMPTETPPDSEIDSGAGAMLQEVLLTLDEMRGWVFASYVSKGKFSREEADAMLTAVEQYVRDLAEGSDHGHIYYMQQALPGLTQQQYRRHYRNAYEYIVRNIFTKARDRLQFYHERDET